MTVEQKNILVEQYIRNVAYNLNQQYPNIVDEDKISKAINMFKDSNEEFDEIKKKIDDLVIELINNYIKANNMSNLNSPTTNQESIVNNDFVQPQNVNQTDLMMSNLENALNSEFVMEMLKRNWNQKPKISLLGNLIGEVYNHMIINKDGYGFQYYITQMEMLYAKLGTKEITLEDFDREKAMLITNIIAQKLKIDTSKGIQENDIKRIKDYFLQEYITNGFVSHSFPEAYRESIMTNGLDPSLNGRADDASLSQEIQKMFLEKGVAAPLGGYPFYGGKGIYFEHDFTRVFQHAINSPEWFNWFTSSDHLQGFQDIEHSPYILRDEQACRQNVIDLCVNAGLSDDQTEIVKQFYSENYAKFVSPLINVGLISKSVVGKNDASFVPANLGLLETITYVMRDGANQYKEHVGNVHNEVILPQNIRLSHIPDANKIISVNSYSRETREHLTSPRPNLEILGRAIDNVSKMSSDMIETVKNTCSLLESRLSSKKSINIVSDFNSHNKNHTISTQNQQNLSNQKKKVKTLKKVIDSNGYANVIILPFVIVFAFVVAFLLVGLLLK